MGQVESAAPPEEIIGKNDTQPLSEAENLILTEQNGLCNRFHTHPTSENYKAIRKHDGIYRKGLGSKIHRMFILGMKTHLTVDDPLTADEKKEYDTEVDRLLCSDTVHTAMDLDEMWSLYYATGDIRFSNRIKNVIDDPTQNSVVRGSAQWSYSSHEDQGLLP